MNQSARGARASRWRANSGVHASTSTAGFWLLVAGGLVYSAGVAFYVIERIPYHKAIWHAFVLVAAVLHFCAISFEFAS